MLFTLRKPQSERFFQLNFEGFRSGGKNKIDKIFRILLEYLKALHLYILKRFLALVILPGKVAILLRKYLKIAKVFLIQKLIWSRGRLGRPVAVSVVMSAAFLVFIVGKLLNSSRFVNAQDIDQDYLNYVTDIIPQRNTATTTIPEDRKRNEAFVYEVEAGDTLSGIGNKYKISTDALKYVNGLNDSSVLNVGQKIVIPPVSGLIHKVASGDTLQSIANKYDVPAQSVADFNYILDVSKLSVGTELVIPGAKVPQPVIVPGIVYSNLASGPSVDPGANKDWCIWPTTTRYISQGFSWLHNGLDIAATTASMPPLYACSDGVVYRAGWDPWGLGLHIRIRHAKGYDTIYGHMSRLNVEVGQEVSQGEVIGLMGSTGRSTGPHVHFIVEFRGVPQNPLNYIN